MAKPFGKQPKDWTRLQSANEFLYALSDARHISLASMITVKNGVATWMHEDVALEFARWLSPSFAIFKIC